MEGSDVEGTKEAAVPDHCQRRVRGAGEWTQPGRVTPSPVEQSAGRSPRSGCRPPLCRPDVTMATRVPGGKALSPPTQIASKVRAEEVGHLLRCQHQMRVDVDDSTVQAW